MVEGQGASLESMNTDKRSGLISTLIIILLFTQVVLSFGIIRKLNGMDQTIAAAMHYGLGEAKGPEYIPDVSPDDDPALGTKGAPVTIIGFSDYECPACAEAASGIKAILSDNPGKVLFVLRDFPLDTRAHAFKAAEAANCAGDQGKYWEMHDLLFANQAQLDPANLKKYAAQLQLDMSQFEDCLDNGKYVNEIRHDMEDGRRYQVGATPTFFVNGYRVVGLASEELQQMIDSASEELR